MGEPLHSIDTNLNNLIAHWPGKSASEPGGVCHPALLHMLDVAAVAEQLIRPFCVAPALRDALVLLISFHDIGKISDSFRSMIMDGVAQPFRHWQLSEALLYVNDAAIDSYIGGTWRQRQALYASVAGHHGQPSDLALGGRPGLPAVTPDMRATIAAIGTGKYSAAQTIEAFCQLWPRASLSDLAPGLPTTALTWWLPGLCAAADWIGSNTTWFKPIGSCDDLDEYLAYARETALLAVTEAGLAGAVSKPALIFDFALRPMQAACADIPLPDGPALALIEDETGAGKTEAALLLAHRMLLAGKGRGLYFALPTMATSDAMFARACTIVGRMMENPTLTLAHGRAGVSQSFRDLIDSAQSGEDAATCTEWLQDSRRRALLADIGIGTIDQALLSVLPVKHQTLRHFGLSSKVLIVDEVHEMGEPYIGQELLRLLQMHRAAGGSAILLTATLPLDLRARLLSIYDGQNDDPAYPALTIAGGRAVTKFATDARPVKGPVQVARLESAEAAVDLLLDAARAGAACVWIRNSVDDAITGVSALAARGISACLLHARYALCDRKRIEAEVLARAGKDGTDRAGFVLVGTQVLEASLDLDFDVMVSDIAPIAALIQRAGRLWRHMDRRPAASRPVPRPVLHILSPDPAIVTDDKWLHGTLGSGAYVYALAEIWRSARAIFQAGQISAPHGLRALIEAVHGHDACDVPEPLQAADLRATGEAAAAGTLALHNLVQLEHGFREAGRGVSDMTYPTRLGEEARVLVLARMVDGSLCPWAGGYGSAADWTLSEVSARRKRLDRLPLPDQSHPAIRAITSDWPDWRRADVRVCPVAEDGKICTGLKYGADAGLIFEGLDSVGLP